MEEKDTHRVSLYNMVKDTTHSKYYFGKFMDENLWFLYKRNVDEGKKMAVTFDDFITLLKCVKLLSKGDASYTQYANFAETVGNEYIDSIEDAIFHHKGAVNPFFVQRPYAIGFRYDTWVAVDYGDGIDLKKLEEEANAGYLREGITSEEFWGKF